MRKNKNPNSFKRMQHTKIKQPPLIEGLKLHFKSHPRKNLKHNHYYNIDSDLSVLDHRIVGAFLFIVVCLFCLLAINKPTIIHFHRLLGHEANDNTSIQVHNDKHPKSVSPVKKTWQAIQNDITNRKTKTPYGRYFEDGHQNASYLSLKSWKASILENTPHSCLSEIRIYPEHLQTVQDHEQSYIVKYTFPQENGKTQIQKYKWFVTYHGHHISHMWSLTNPVFSKTISN